MSAGCAAARRGERGIALISALLLLMILTILGLSMFRSFPTQEKIAGNVREKERAVHAANSAQQFAEWWLMQSNNTANGDLVCGAQSALFNGNLTTPEVQICSNALYTLLAGGLVTDVTQVPWCIGGTGCANVGTQYTPYGMNVAGGPTVSADSTYVSAPVFYIADLGAAGDGQGEAYQIDAYAYAGSAATVAVVESIYEVAQGVVNRTGE